MTGAGLGSGLPLIALGWPLLIGALAGLPMMRARRLALLPLAPLPGLWLAISLLLAPPGAPAMMRAPDLLLGASLGAGRPAALLLLLTAGLWLAAGIHARAALAGGARNGAFAGFWCLALAGNLGVFLAQDVITFYVAFAAVSLSAYFLVVHDRGAAAFRAGRVYIVLAMIGEVCLLAGFLICADAAGGLEIARIRAALAASPLAPVAGVLLVAGFGLKAGLVPLHVWLPLAHPAAPVPASAVLSGAIVKAGLIGLMMFAPSGDGLLGVVAVLGYGGAFVAAWAGLRHRQPKTILAYSTVSQMGLMLGLFASLARGPGGDFAQLAQYAFHHGLAKGALFMGVSVVVAAGGRWRIGALVAGGVLALSVAGAPLTGGALAKAAAKAAVDGAYGGGAAVAITFSAVFSTMLLGWLLVRLAASPAAPAPAGRAAARPSWLLAGPSLLVGLAAVAAPYALWAQWGGLAADYPWRARVLFDGAWPIALGLCGLALMRARGWPLGRNEEADPLQHARRLGLALRPLAGWSARAMDGPGRLMSRGHRLAGALGHRVSAAAQTVEDGLLRWPLSGVALIVLALAILASNGIGTTWP